MNINNVSKILTGMNLFATGTALGMTAKLVVDTLRNKYETQDQDGEVDGNVQISAADFEAMQNELEELKLELAELKETNAPPEAQPLETTLESENLTVEIQDEPTTVPEQNTQAPVITKESEIETQPDTNTSVESSNTTLKEIDISNLTQNEANEIWSSYLKGNCEYDLNENNIEEFCLKFGFDSSLAK